MINNKKKKLAIYILQFICGAVVLVLELTGTRIISPFYGSSLYAWASLISVTLLSLAGGYFLGGHLADKYSSPLVLMALLVSGGIYTVALPLISGPVLLAANPLGVAAGTFVSSFLLFSPPLVILGTVSPFSLKMFEGDISRIGLSAGRLYAVSTVGSFGGALLTGFVLIPNLGIALILYICGVVLACTGIAGLLINRKIRLTLILFFVFAAALTAAIVSGTTRKSKKDVEVVVRKESSYGSIRIIDDSRDGYLYLLINSGVQGGIRKSDMETDFDYIHFLSAVTKYNPSGNKALLIGLGAGLLPKLLDKYGVETDVAEIDPAVVEIAREYFGYSPSGEVFIEDGRYVLNNTTRNYDFIFMDAYAGGSIPYQLYSKEVFVKIKNILNPGGILAMNVIDVTDRDKAELSKSIQRTLENVFRGLHIYSNNDGSDVENIIFFASADKLAGYRYDPESFYPDNINRFFLRSLSFLKRNYTSDGGMLITDFNNPLESTSARMSGLFRKLTHDYFGAELFASLY